MSCYLTDFRHIRPKNEFDQDLILEWLTGRHAEASIHSQEQDCEKTGEIVADRFRRIGLGKEKISKRGVQYRDLLAKNSSEMELFGVSPEEPHGKGSRERHAFFDREATEVFEQFYPENAELPSQLIHVTCTGYISPSPAQKVVSMRGFGQKTTVTHAYHMGCYGAISAVRMGTGFLFLPSPMSAPQVDIVHTELCTLHLQPMRHTMDQLIVESLFGDGFIKYSARKSPSIHGSSLKSWVVYDQMIPGSQEYMTWNVGNHGMNMTLSKEVPVVVTRFLKGYLERMCQMCGVDIEKIKKMALFAVHPGGPKILQYVKENLNLAPHQLKHSEQILYQFGNMSSATLPHIWETILNDPSVENGTMIVSLAFGPGMTFCGGLFEKVGADG